MPDDKEIINQLIEAMRPLIPKDDVGGMSGSDVLTHNVKVRDVKAARRAIRDAASFHGKES